MRLWHVLRHLSAPSWLLRRALGPAELDALTASIAASERRHRGEICVAVDSTLPWSALRRDLDSRQRAAELFQQYGVDQTREATGILIYVQLLDRQLEILADRGIAACVAQAEWDAICRAVATEFAAGRYANGLHLAVDRATALLAQHFPAGDDNPDELANRPRVR